MRYAIFDSKQDADNLAQIIQRLCDQNHIDNTPKIIKNSFYVGWMNKWAVSMEYEPLILPDNVVDSVDQPEAQQ